ncbi:MAG TPA: Crp/Fnr family transcriptional regulator [Ktedonobacterales bacterium]|nr:Crp/Fnr family transcriptional regulator [Ktedonobacterales bacterium]
MRLEIYVSSQSSDYQESLLIAEQAKAIPGLDVALIKVDDNERLSAPEEERPTHLLDSQVISMERSSWEGFFKHLRWQARAHLDGDAAPHRAQAAPAQQSAASPAHTSSSMAMDLFADLKEDAIAAVYQHMTQRKYAKGQLIYLQDEPSPGLFLLRQGRVQVYRMTSNGKRLELATIPAGTFFGEVPLIGEAIHYASAEAVEDVVVGIFNRQHLEQVIREWPVVGLRLISELSRRLNLDASRLEELAYQSAPARLAAALLRLHQEGGEQMITMTHQELGEVTGLLRETVTKMLNEFRSAGLVELHRGRIHLRDVAGLRRLLKEYDLIGSRQLSRLAAS